MMDISAPGKHQTLELTPSVTRIHIYEIGDQLVAWSKYVNVAAIFERRKLRLKSAVRSWARGYSQVVASNACRLDVCAPPRQTFVHR